MLADHGAKVAFCARNEENIKKLAAYQPESSSGSVEGFPADMGDKESVNAFLDKVDAGGIVDIVINNVGASPSRNFLYMSDGDWESLFQLNLMSAVRCTKRFLPAMRKQKWGRVVMIASAAAKSPGAVTIDYGATKAAMVAVAKALSGKYGRDNILFNSILPGLIRTAMWERAATEIAEAGGSTMEDVIANNSKRVPLGRYGTPEEVASVVTFLCTESASYVSGARITVDGAQDKTI